MQKAIKFDAWHITPMEDRPYAEAACKEVNKLLKNSPGSLQVVEIGCGLGDILAKIDTKQKYKEGLDIGKAEIRAAKILHPGIRFRQGSFSQVKNKKNAVLILLDFLHMVPEDILKKSMSELCSCNHIQYIVVDRVQSPPYRYSHDFEKIFQELGYDLYRKTRGFEAWKYTRRYIEIYKEKKSVTIRRN